MCNISFEIRKNKISNHCQGKNKIHNFCHVEDQHEEKIMQ